MPLPPFLQRALVGASLGALLGSGVTGGIGAQFVSQFLKPLSQSPKALDVMGRFIYERERAASGDEWEDMPNREREVWIGRAEAAIECMIQMMSRALAGKVKR